MVRFLEKFRELQNLLLWISERCSTGLDDILVSELKRRMDMLSEQDETRDEIAKQLERLQE